MAKKKVKEEDTDGPPEQPSWVSSIIAILTSVAFFSLKILFSCCLPVASILGTLALPALDQIPCNSIGSCALALTEIIAYNIVFLLVSDSIHLIGVFSYFDDRGQGVISIASEEIDPLLYVSYRNKAQIEVPCLHINTNNPRINTNHQGINTNIQQWVDFLGSDGDRPLTVASRHLHQQKAISGVVGRSWP
ncbi:hypothetical protein C8R45DRAFT_1074901 [Mycena sanguinolenta]|nr:hypothetical protein C8R45DRAFT_1074901 [Mycena sanguinolenta]